MSAAFDKAFSVVIGNEGGYVNNPADPGGETNFGISKHAYPNVDIRGLTRDGAKAIYLRDYWTPCGGDSLPPVVGVVVFDAAVNNGVKRAVEWLQEAVGSNPDGVIGPNTLAAVKATVARRGVNALAAEFTAQRLCFMAALPTWKTFGLGWARRLCRLPYDAMA